MNPRILMYLYNYYPFESANTNVMLPIIKVLQQHYEVDIYAANLNGTAPVYEEMNGLRVYRTGTEYSKITQFQSFLLQVYDASENGVQKPFRRLKKLILKILHTLVPSKWVDKFRVVARTHTMAQLIEENDYTAVITVAAPVITHFDLLPLAKNGYLKKRGIKWFAYFSDPYATFIGHKAQLNEFMQQEYEIYQWSDGVFTTPEIAADNLHYPLKDFAQKTWPVQLANLAEVKAASKIDYLDDKKINCLYMGSFINLLVRDPSYFYQIAQACPEDIHFHIICYFENEESRALRDKYLENAPNVHWHERASMEECHSLMCHAQIMINLGNKCTNQTPSKIFDYIGAGKPVVNFYSIEQDTSKKYLERYPLKIDIKDKNELDSNDVLQFVKFCRENKNSHVPFEQIKLLYAEFLAENVANEFMKIFLDQVKIPVKQDNNKR